MNPQTPFKSELDRYNEEALERIGARIRAGYRQEPADDESNLPRTGIKIVLGIIVGIFVVLWLIGWLWSLYANR